VLEDQIDAGRRNTPVSKGTRARQSVVCASYDLREFMGEQIPYAGSISSMQIAIMRFRNCELPFSADVDKLRGLPSDGSRLVQPSNNELASTSDFAQSRTPFTIVIVAVTAGLRPRCMAHRRV